MMAAAKKALRTHKVRTVRDAKKTALAVAARINEPLTPWTEIARRFNVSEALLREKFEEAGYGLQALPTVQELVEKNHLLTSAADNELARRVLLEPELVRTADLISLRDAAFKQNQLMQGKPTEMIGIRAIIEQIQSKPDKPQA